MHECIECGLTCDCDGEDLFYEIAPDECDHECEFEHEYETAPCTLGQGVELECAEGGQ